MTQTTIQQYFTTIGRNQDCLYSTIDDRVFTKEYLAIEHIKENNLEQEYPDVWFEQIKWVNELQEA